MTNRRSKLNALLWQLRRRHVYRVVAAYGAVGFFVLQTAELVLPGLPSPQWLYPLITGLVLAGLPIAVVLGWIYDITESGITRTSGTRRRLPIQVPAPQ